MSQLPTPPMISATHKCVEELLDINKDQLMALGLPKMVRILMTAYVDGVSITRGYPRQHIWTFMAAIQENSFYEQW